MQMPVLMGDTLHALADQAAAFEALLLIVSALHKGLEWSHLQSVLRRFAGVPRSLAPMVLAGVAVSETVAGGLLLVPTWRTRGALLAAVLWTVYLMLIVRAIAQGRSDADCGCSFGKSQHTLGSYQLVRNVLLIGLAVGVALERGQTADGGVHGMQVLGACALLALYGALDQAMNLRPLRSGEML